MMKNNFGKNCLVIAITIFFICTSIIPPIGGIESNHNILIDNKTETHSEEINSFDNDTEYWALLIAVGVYAGHPEEDRPSMLYDVEYLHEKLLVSEHWKEENIKVIKGRNATLFNIIKGFRWLDKREDENDFSLVYITSHGGPLSRDRFPWDEEDGCDEILATYRSFIFPILHISDDFLNLLLSLLNSKGVCVIVESCHAGGFNDPPYFNNHLNDNRMDANEWMHEFAEDIRGSGRVVLMSCREDESSHRGFATWLIKALTGYADVNEDDLVSAEEAFDYVVENFNDPYMHPTIYDDYPGELQLTEVEIPPSTPEGPIGQIIGDMNTTYIYSTVSTDPEGGKISYGWDWDSDYIVDEWSGPVDSGIWVNTSRSWETEGTYNIRVLAEDERGLRSSWSYIVVIMCDDNIPDQWQKVIGFSSYINGWYAQSFVPSLSTLSKVELALCSLGQGGPKPFNLSIRDNLSGDNIAEVSIAIPGMGDWDKFNWITFDFEDLDIIPGNTYYIVCEKIWGYDWRWKEDNPYPLGEIFVSDDGYDWMPYSSYYKYDGCFVSWGK